jgi:hypothetical protein
MERRHDLRDLSKRDIDRFHLCINAGQLIVTQAQQGRCITRPTHHGNIA